MSLFSGSPRGPISAALVQATASSLASAQLAPAMVAAGYPAAGVPSALTTLLGAALTNVPAAALPSSLQPFYPAAISIAGGAAIWRVVKKPIGEAIQLVPLVQDIPTFPLAPSGQPVACPQI